MSRRRFSISCAAAGLLFVVGCGERKPVGERPPLHPVAGRLTVAGKPVEGVTLSLQPVSGASAQQFVPTAVTAADGAFQFGTFAERDGAPAGEYAMTCVWMKQVSESEDSGAVDQLRGRYSNAERSKVKVSVPLTSSELAPIDLR